MTPVRRGKHVARGATAAAATAVLAATAATNHAALAGSVAVLGHLRWIWIPAVIVLESASMAALAGMQRRLLAAGGARVGVRSMLATTLAANALSVSVPLAGPELGTAFAFRRFTRQGADAPLAVWSLVVGGVQAVGAAIPWHLLLLAYGSGVGAQTLNITPGGFGITEGTLGLTLVAAGLRVRQALAAVLLYRLVSFWLIASAGWLIFLWLRRRARPAAALGRQRRHPASMPARHQGEPT